ncbi:MAG: RNA polymerase sigma factor, partial [Planctomycetota bacterium]
RRRTTPDDAELVRDALGGSRAAFDRLIDRYWRSAVGMARQKTRNWSDAEDAAQEAFILAYRKLAQLRDPERFGGWLFTIVAPMCPERGRRRRPTPVEDVESLDGPRPAPTERDPDRGVLRDTIQEAIGALPERYRAVVVLRYGHSMAVKEIGRTLGLPVGTVVSHMFRANRLLRTRLRHLVGS